MNILEEVKEAKTVGISGHVRPDGDCVGSCMALFSYLKKYCSDKIIKVYLEKVPEVFKGLKGIEQVQSDEETIETFDVFISLDCGDIKRLGNSALYFENAKKTINIDHHISNEKFAQINYVYPNASSSCEVLFSVLEEDKIDVDIATALYIGIIHDTGVFKYSCTSKKTMEIAGILMEKGIPFSKIIDETFYQKTYMQNQILGRCLLESFLILDGTCIVSCASKNVMEFYGAEASDLEGVIDQLRGTKGVETALLLHELAPQKYKVSMRSNQQVDVSRIAKYFGGGGHVRAAGCTMEGSFYDVVNNLTEHIEAQMKCENPF